MPLIKYKLYRKSLQDSINLNLSSSIAIESQTSVSENNHKRQRIESVEQNIPLESTSTEHAGEESQAKKPKTKATENQLVQPPVIQPLIVQPTVPTLQESISEKEIISEPPLVLPSINGRIQELKSKTPTWKAQQPVAKGNTQGNTFHSILFIPH
jgi:hypothetical protein